MRRNVCWNFQNPAERGHYPIPWEQILVSTDLLTGYGEQTTLCQTWVAHFVPGGAKYPTLLACYTEINSAQKPTKNWSVPCWPCQCQQYQHNLSMTKRGGWVSIVNRNIKLTPEICTRNLQKGSVSGSKNCHIKFKFDSRNLWPACPPYLTHSHPKKNNT